MFEKDSEEQTEEKLNISDVVTLAKESLDDESHWYYSQHYGDIGIIVEISCVTHAIAIEWKRSGHSAWYEQKHLNVIHEFDWSDYDGR